MPDVGAALLVAFEADTGLKPAGDVVKAELINRHRAKLINRVEAMLRSLREERTKSHRQVATNVVEACLKEVFS